MKPCTKCGVEKSEDEFYKRKRDKGSPQCKFCERTAVNKYHTTPRGKEVRRKAVNKYHTTPRGKEVRRKTVKKCRATPEGMESQRKASRVFRATLKGKEAKKRAREKCRATPEGREVLKRDVNKCLKRIYAKYKMFINDLKLKAGCSVCGYNEDPNQIDYHHMDKTTKLFNISDGHRHTQAAILTELAKCIVVCKPCHKKFRKGILK